MKVKLFCFPHAGGSAAIFNKWKGYFSEWNVDIIPIELSGRGNRGKEPFYSNMSECIEDLYLRISPHLAGDSLYMFYGHSMGALLSYELAQVCRNKGQRNPLAIIISGRSAPHEQERERKIHTLSEKEFIDEIILMGGTPRELFSNHHVKNYFLPILQSDFKLIENYEIAKVPSKLECSLYVLHGNKDLTVEGDVKAWSNYTTTSFEYYEFNGGHFFIWDSEPDVLKTLEDILLKNGCKMYSML